MRRQRGQAMTEYLLIMVMLVLLCMVTMRLAGTRVEAIYSNISASLSHNVTYCTVEAQPHKPAQPPGCTP